MTIEEMRERKRELGYSYEQIAELAHMPVGTVQKVLGGITKSPRYDTRKALEEVFAPKPVNMTQKAQPVYAVKKKQGDYTIEDYFALPDDRRVELIDGVIYDMAVPTMLHQLLAGELYSAFRNYIFQKKGKCIPAMSPLDVQLDCDDKTMVQPDVVIICDRDKLKYGRVYGAPDLVVEVLSPSTGKRDGYIKVLKYLDAGVRECWFVDPLRKRIIVHDLESDRIVIDMYTFNDEIPVKIFNEECRVNFREIYEYVDFLYQRE